MGFLCLFIKFNHWETHAQGNTSCRLRWVVQWLQIKLWVLILDVSRATTNDLHEKLPHQQLHYAYIWYPPRPILSQNLLVFALFCCFLLCLNVCFFWRLFYMFKKLCRVVKTLPPLIKPFSFNRKGFLQNLEKTKKPKLFGEVLVSGQKMFFLGFPWLQRTTHTMSCCHEKSSWGTEANSQLPSPTCKRKNSHPKLVILLMAEILHQWIGSVSNYV